MILRGVLGEEFGREWMLAVESPMEALTAIARQRPNFERRLLELCEAHIGVRVRVGGRDVVRNAAGLARAAYEDVDDGSARENLVEVAEDLGTNCGRHNVIEIVPEPIAAGKIGAILLIVVGVALVVLTGGAALGLGGVFASFAAGVGGLGLSLGAVGLVGVGLIAAGASTLLAGGATSGTSGVERGDFDRAESPDEVTSFSFTGPVNTRGTNRPVKVVVGRLTVGSHMISLGIHSA